MNKARLLIGLILLGWAQVACAQVTAPTIASVSNSQTVTEGQSFSFTVSINGTSPFTYQWQKGGVAIPGATNGSHTISLVRPADAGSYTVVVSNFAGSITSPGILLAVTPAVAPVITFSPNVATYTIGDTINLSISVSGTSPFTYQWQRNGVTLLTTTNSNYSKPNAQLSDAGNYIVTVTNIAGATTSGAISVQINPPTPPVLGGSAANVTLGTGESLNLNLGVSGTAPFTYQWYKDGVAIPNAVSSSYSRSNLTAADSGTYNAIVTNIAGSATSAPVKLTVTGPPLPSAPVITSFSTPFTTNLSDSFFFSVSANGPTASYSYQWFKDTKLIPGATNSSYGRNSATVDDVGTYTATVSNSSGSVTSDSTALSVTLPQLPIISSQPGSAAVTAGASFFLLPSYRGTGLTYQWRRNGVAIPSANTTGYSGNAPTTAGASDTYTVLVTNSVGSVLSEPAVVTALAPPATGPAVITSDPASQTVQLGEGIFLQAGVFWATPPTPLFQWRRDGVVIAGATEGNYTKFNAAASDAGSYTLTVTSNGASVVSGAAKITVPPSTAPVITEHPSSYNLLPGDSFSGLSITTRTPIGLTYQWRKDGVAIAGATNSSLSLNSTQPSNAGSYTVVVASVGGASVTSEPGVITFGTTRGAISSTSGSILRNFGDFIGLQLTSAVPNPTVQWKKDGVVVQSGSQLLYSPGVFTAALVGTYVATVSGTGVTAMDSPPIKVGVLDSGVAPTLTRQPTSSIITVGGSFSVFVEVVGERPYTYQWRKDGVNLPGATNQSYSINSVVTTSAGVYSAVASNRVGSVTSDNATLTVPATAASGAPVFRNQPVSQVLSPTTGSGTLSVTLVDPTDATYQWSRNGVPISGATSSSLQVFSSGTAGRYQVVATNRAGSSASNEVSVTNYEAATAPRFTSPPSSQAVLPGRIILLSASASGGTAPTYQWYKNGTALPGATTLSYLLPAFQAADVASYWVVATAPEGVASSTAAILTFLTPPVGAPLITQQPKPGTIFPAGQYTLTAGVAGNPAPTYQWLKDGTAVPGATNASLTITSQTGAGAYQLTATNSSGSITTNSTQVSSGTAIVFNPPTPTQTAPAGSAITLNPSASSTLPLTYQWQKNGVNVPGATSASLTLGTVKPSDAGTYVLLATNNDGTTSSPGFVLTVPVSPYAGVYFGTFSTGDQVALSVGADGIGHLLGQIPTRDTAVIARGFVVQPNGSFAATGETVTHQAAGFYSGAISGSIANNGTVSGSLAGLGVSFTGAVKAASGPTAAVAGYYSGVTLSSTLSEMHFIAAADATVQLVGLDVNGVRSGRGVIDATGAFVVTQTQFTYRGNVGSDGTAPLTGTLILNDGSVTLLAGLGGASGAERLANVSTRTLAGSGARTLIAGFAINGTAPKDVLIRATGPALSLFGVGGVLPNPRLRVFKGSTVLYENDDWSIGGSVSQLSGAFARLGAFPLAIGSADAALLVRLDPGSYTAQVSSDAVAAGVALVEVYDASTGVADAQRLVNVSTRSEVGVDGDILIVGVVVTGTAPKKLLVRGIGPGLATFGVTGVLAAPRLQLFKGTTLLRENTGWSKGTDAALISDAATQVGAFALAEGSADSALLLYLAPGAYTAQISGVNRTTGVALVEVYEVP